MFEKRIKDVLFDRKLVGSIGFKHGEILPVFSVICQSSDAVAKTAAESRIGSPRVDEHKHEVATVLNRATSLVEQVCGIAVFCLPKRHAFQWALYQNNQVDFILESTQMVPFSVSGYLSKSWQVDYTQRLNLNPREGALNLDVANGKISTGFTFVLRIGYEGA
jgi:hypothetical protein